ncbi:hypothetical protein Dip518_001244 [Parelusimicrobium proximum]|uniref:hypothetical protein n=1 Tax=Parelusimicrobium proximum TaxID=3228953 RepID=UPI003D1649C7
MKTKIIISYILSFLFIVLFAGGIKGNEFFEVALAALILTPIFYGLLWLILKGLKKIFPNGISPLRKKIVYGIVKATDYSKNAVDTIKSDIKEAREDANKEDRK